MGTINYYTSNYITLALQTWEDIYTLVNGECEKDIRDLTPEEIEDYYNEVEAALNKYDFYYFHVVIKPGYYEGFSIFIENNFPVCFDWSEDKRGAQKEITQIKKFLLECVDIGLVKCSPGWCTGYSNGHDTVKAIKEAIKEMREDVRQTPTEYTYYRREAS